MQYDLGLFLQIPAAGMIEHLHVSPPKALVLVLVLCFHLTIRSYHSINHAKNPKYAYVLGGMCLLIGLANGRAVLALTICCHLRCQKQGICGFMYPKLSSDNSERPSFCLLYMYLTTGLV